MKYTQRKIKEWAGKQADQRTTGRSNYPAGPSTGKDIMRIYENLLKKAVRGKKKFRACVLGATPETRDLVLKHGGELTTIDISWEMIQKCNALMRHANSEKEIIVKVDWLNNPLADNYYDVILGDGVTNNVGLKDQDKFFKEIKRLLKKDGYLILREGVISPKRKRRSVEEINKDFMDGRIHWFDMFFDFYFYSDITKKVHDPVKIKWYMAKLFKEIEKAFKQKRLNKKAFDAMWWLRGNIIHTFMPRSRLEKFIEKYFRLTPTKQAKDYKFSEDTMIFFFGKVRK